MNGCSLASALFAALFHAPPECQVMEHGTAITFVHAWGLAIAMAYRALFAGLCLPRLLTRNVCGAPGWHALTFRGAHTHTLPSPRNTAQPLYQCLGLAFALAMAIGGGLLAGLLVSKVGPRAKVGHALDADELFEDELFWKDVEHAD